MLWIGMCEVVSLAAISGIFAGGLMALCEKSTHRFNMKVLENYWNSDIKRLESQLAAQEQRISTISVYKPVSNPQQHSNTQGYYHKRRFNHKG